VVRGLYGTWAEARATTLVERFGLPRAKALFRALGQCVAARLAPVERARLLASVSADFDKASCPGRPARAPRARAGQDTSADS
jgi:hypothetical protein